MALQKVIENHTGVPVEYWKIAKIEMWGKQNIAIYLDGFVTQTARDSLKSPASAKSYNVPVSDYQEYFSVEAMDLSVENIYQICYRYIKEKVSDFTGSLDI